MTERTATIGSRVGLHARPASLFIEAVRRTGVAVKISKPGGTPLDATSILSLMSLGAANGDQVVLTAEGDGADAALDELAALLESDLDAVE
ncbi:HPr family phosphocarrier protein [Clavibacter sepedonicus]|uniref:Phosphocarrier protein HPr n=3 Tax=Clavibacter TaxID=1573 RepID=A0A251Y248_9MICO|nr:MULTISPECIES: HPr family phosphocarrier protein [Clavibacter]ALD12721.1 dihydroxyacetone kinase [Clavibacter capsici]MBD5381843.1 HPr family phosphocarrier protein [Clavibacter sp.]OQJ47555.1 HPr family phosphocarrier protein [Clavibacter sepedonicus]OQJ53111.1 HPr family phosphocarrier protein [Clavibacter sepedonicus]OUE18335.1 Phosphocarrier protein HPr [Clavibacter michiganensis]